MSTARTKKKKNTRKSPSAKRTSRQRVRRLSLRDRWSRFVASLRLDERRRDIVFFILGILLFAITAYFSVAVISFFLSGGADQAAIAHASSGDILLGRIEVVNVCGPQGAFLADWFINRLFGLGSIFILLYFFSLSLKLMRVLPSVRPLRRLAFIGALTVWSSVTFGWLSTILPGSTFIWWGGAHGVTISNWLKAAVGPVGLFLILLALALILILFFRTENIGKMRKVMGLSWFKRKPKDVPAGQGEEENAKKDILTPKRGRKEKKGGISDEGVDVPSSPIPLGATSNHLQEVDAPVAATDSQGAEMKVEIAQGDELVHPEELKEDVPKNDPRYGLAHYRFPPLDILTRYEEGAPIQNNEEIEANKHRIIKTLNSFNMRVTPKTATVGPTVTLYEVVPDAGIKISRIRSIEEDIAMSLKSEGIRIIAPMPGKGTIGIEVPNKTPQTVSMYSVLASRRFQEQKSKMELPIALGKTITNEAYLFDLAKTPHLLIAGATGQGKSVGLNALIASLLYSKRPEELKFVLVDPKMLEFSLYEELEYHYLAKLPDEEDAIITDMTKVVPTLNSLCILMDERYKQLTAARVRNVKEYNKQILEGKLSKRQGHEFMPYVVVVVDEFADLIMSSGKDAERPIVRIAQKARAAGIHMVIATQRPSTDIITGIIKANFPSRIAFKVFSMIDSRTILDTPGANQLVGRGDMLFNQGKDMIRLQCAFIDTPEVEKLVEHISRQERFSSAYLLPESPVELEEGASRGFNRNEKDALFEEVARMVVSSQQGSTSNIQRKFNIGYNRAGRLTDQLEAAGIVSAQDGSKPRQVLIQDETVLESVLENLR